MSISSKKLVVDDDLINKVSTLEDFLKDKKISPDFIFIDADGIFDGKPYNFAEDIVLEIIKIKFNKKISVFFETKNYMFYLEEILKNKLLRNKKMISHQHFYFEK